MNRSQIESPAYGVDCERGCLASPLARRRLRYSPAKVGGKGFRHMTRARGVQGIATAVLIVAALTSCAERKDPDLGPSPSVSSSAPTTSTPSPRSDSEIASESATAVLREFYNVRNRLRQHVKEPLRLLDDVAISTELAAQKQLFNKERERGLHQTGDTKIVELDVTSVNLDNSDPDVGNVPTVQIDLCFDVSDVDVIDKHGNSVIAPDRPDTGWIQFLVSNYQWDADPEGAWRVASSQDIERTPCDVS